MAMKKLIEVALPLDKINAESAREKSLRNGHPSTLHLWWARRPLVTARAVIFASLIDDPSEHPEHFPTEDDQNRERKRLFDIIVDLAKWENSNNTEIIDKAKSEILRAVNGKMPELLDPFAGGGTIPYEAQRLGLKVYAHDLNPVAVMINKSMIEIAPKFSGFPAISAKQSNQMSFGRTWKGSQGLAEDVAFYGEKLKERAFSVMGDRYPTVKLPSSLGGEEAIVLAWLWTRVIKCPNPVCGCEMPLIRSCTLTKKKGKTAWIEPVYDEKKKLSFKMHYSGKPTIEGTVNRKGAKCACCGSPVEFDYIREEGKAKRMESKLMAIVAEGKSQRLYVEPNEQHILAGACDRPENYPDAELPYDPQHIAPPNYGFLNYADLFSNRQLMALCTFSDIIKEMQDSIYEDAVKAGMPNDHLSLRDGGRGAKAYSEALRIYLSFLVDRMADKYSTICPWNVIGEKVEHTFGRQAIPMTWDYAEANPFSNSTGCFDNTIGWIIKCLENFPVTEIVPGIAIQKDAQNDSGMKNVMISTDPPYYDNINYSELADFFYIWMRYNLKDVYPSLFATMLVPKNEELIATPYRHGNSKSKAKSFFEKGMLEACKQIYNSASDDYPVTIYYAYKQNTAEETASSSKVASTGWETMLNAIIQSGFVITGTWPVRTERETGLKAYMNALATSIVLVCRKRSGDSSICTRRNFINELKRELRPALHKLQASNIAPVDLAQSAIGPGMGVYSKYSKVLEADGTPMTVRSALQVINQELDLYFNEQDGELDTESRFCVDLYSQMAFNEMPFGDANTLATAKNTSVAIMASHGTLYAQKGKVHLIERPELPTSINEHEGSIWLLCQQLTYKMEKEGIEGCAAAIANMYGSNAERAKDLAYRLYTIAERKKWAQEAYAYNALVVAWPEIQSRAAELKAIVPQQLTLEDFMNNNN